MQVSESGAWYDFFVKKNNLSDDQFAIPASLFFAGCSCQSAVQVHRVGTLT